METFKYIASNRNGTKITNYVVADDILSALKSAQEGNPFRTILSIREITKVTKSEMK